MALDDVRLGDQRLVLHPHRRHRRIDPFEQRLLGLAPGDAFLECGAHRARFLGGGKGLIELEQRRALDLLGFARRLRVGDDGEDQPLQFRRGREQRDGVVVALAHLAAIEAGQRRHRGIDLGFGQHEVLAVQVVEARRHVARHLDVLDLVAADRHLVRLEHQDVGRHQHRVHEEAHVHAGIRVLLGGDVLVHRRLVGVRTVEQALARDTGEQPGQLRNLGDVGLAVEPHALGVQPGSQPGCRDLQRRALHARRVGGLDQRVVVGQEVEALHARLAAGGDRRTNRPRIVAEVGRARRGDPGEDALDGRMADGHGSLRRCVGKG